MQKTIIATLSRTSNHTPLAGVRNLPGQDADLTPAQLRALARVLLAIADASEAMPMHAKHFTPRQREFELSA